MENCPFIVDLPIKNGDFSSYQLTTESQGAQTGISYSPPRTLVETSRVDHGILSL